MSAKDKILQAALTLFYRQGYTATTVAAIRDQAEVSNGSFFHAFPSKEALGAALYLHVLRQYHDHMLAALNPEHSGAQGIAELVQAHLNWVSKQRPQAHFLFQQAQAEWVQLIRSQQAQANRELELGASQWYRARVEAGELLDLPYAVFMAQLIGPAQLICRAWLAGRSKDKPQTHAAALAAAATRALSVA